ncbi:MAG: glycosyltransferase, partial [Proteiniphilum sp.]
LEGFLMQKTDFKYEILIHDDASTDGTTEIIKKYETKFPDIMKPLYEDENQWIKGRRGSTVFNYPRAKGKYIALCEGDDYWIDPLKLQKQVDFLEQYPEYGLVFTDFNVQREKQKMILGIFKNKILPVYTTFEEHLINAGFLAPCTWVLRKELIARQNFGYAVDGSFILMLDTMQQTSLFYGRNNGSISSIKRECQPFS